MAVVELHVNGMTCEHCVAHVRDEIEEAAHPTAIDINLVKGGTSTVTVTSEAPIADDVLAEAIDEAGNYTIVDTIRH